jgi:hypothetical protein
LKDSHLNAIINREGITNVDFIPEEDLSVSAFSLEE